MTLDDDTKALGAVIDGTYHAPMNSAGTLKSTWIAPGYTYPYPSTYWPPVSITSAPQPKSDGPFIIATLAQLLGEGKITEDTFARLVERVIQRGT